MKAEIEICMGSSCYSRGNGESLGVIEKFIRDNGLDADVKLKGSLCMKQCSKGPTIIIDGEVFNEVHSECVLDLLRHHLD